MVNTMKTFTLLFISIFFYGCGGIANVANTYDTRIKNKDIYTDIEVQNNNIYYQNGMDTIGRDRDPLPVKTLKRKDGKFEIHKNYSNNKSQYLETYEILDKNRVMIGWEFVHCDKRIIDINNIKEYQKCLKNTRITHEEDNIYRIGVSKLYFKKYGYTKLIGEETKHEDDLKVINELIKKEKICKNGFKIVEKEYWSSFYNLRYYIECFSK